MIFLRAQAIVTGRVQGVWFRHSTMLRATELGVGGWVRNASNGCVECAFEGPEEAVRQAIEFVRNGPPQARVDQVQVEYQKIEAPAPDFQVL